MPFITGDKTNWVFLVIVFCWAIVVAGVALIF